MTVKKLENSVTRFGVLLLFILTVAGIVFVFDVAFDMDLFSDNAKTMVGILLSIMCVLVASSVLVSIMLNVSRIANSIEEHTTAKFKSKDSEPTSKAFADTEFKDVVQEWFPPRENENPADLK